MIEHTFEYGNLHRHSPGVSHLHNSGDRDGAQPRHAPQPEHRAHRRQRLL